MVKQKRGLQHSSMALLPAVAAPQRHGADLTEGTRFSSIQSIRPSCGGHSGLSPGRQQADPPVHSIARIRLRACRMSCCTCRRCLIASWVKVPMLERVPIPRWSAGSGRAAMHSTPFFPLHGGRPASLTGPCLGSAAGARQHRSSISWMPVCHFPGPRRGRAAADLGFAAAASPSTMSGPGCSCEGVMEGAAVLAVGSAGAAAPAASRGAWVTCPTMACPPSLTDTCRTVTCPPPVRYRLSASICAMKVRVSWLNWRCTASCSGGSANKSIWRPNLRAAK